MTTDIRAALGLLVEAVVSGTIPDIRDAINTARTALAEAEPEPPAAGEVAELVAELRHFIAGYQQMRGLDPEHVYSIHRGDAMEAHLRISRLSRIAELLERLAPQPVPEELSDGPVVPESREPAAVVGDPSDEEILEWANSSDSPVPQEFVSPDVCGRKHYSASEQFCWTVRAVLARWGRQPAPDA